MAEKQSVHRQALETKVIATDARNSTTGVWLGFFIGMSTILGGLFLSYAGKPGGGWFAGSGLVALVSVFVYGTKAKIANIKGKRHN